VKRCNASVTYYRSVVLSHGRNDAKYLSVQAVPHVSHGRLRRLAVRLQPFTQIFEVLNNLADIANMLE